jgi:Na+-driven multidrug efflux pump
MEYLHAVPPSWVALGVAVVLGNAMAGAGATRTTMAVDAAVILCFQFPACILAVVGVGASRVALFELVAVTNVVGALAYASVFATGRWKQAREAPAS